MNNILGLYEKRPIQYLKDSRVLFETLITILKESVDISRLPCFEIESSMHALINEEKVEELKVMAKNLDGEIKYNVQSTLATLTEKSLASEIQACESISGNVLFESWYTHTLLLIQHLHAYRIKIQENPADFFVEETISCEIIALLLAYERGYIYDQTFESNCKVFDAFIPVNNTSHFSVSTVESESSSTENSEMCLLDEGASADSTRPSHF